LGLWRCGIDTLHKFRSFSNYPQRCSWTRRSPHPGPYNSSKNYDKAQAAILFPQSLTAWRLHGYAITKATQVGDATNEVTATKKLLVRLEAPRFFVERDEVVLSANVHHYLSKTKTVRAELVLPADIFEPLSSPPANEKNSTKELHLTATATVKPNGEDRGIISKVFQLVSDEVPQSQLRYAYHVRLERVPKKLASDTHTGEIDA
jgi:uncharacterized protein YfaS (alpha-2-macroglobulin family)